MKRVLLLSAFATLLAGLVLAGPAAAAASGPQSPAHPVVVHGVIAGFDPAHHLMGVITPRGPLAVAFGPHTRVFLDGVPARIIDLRPGMRVVVVGRPDPQHHVLRARFIGARS